MFIAVCRILTAISQTQLVLLKKKSNWNISASKPKQSKPQTAKKPFISGRRTLWPWAVQRHSESRGAQLHCYRHGCSLFEWFSTEVGNATQFSVWPALVGRQILLQMDCVFNREVRHRFISAKPTQKVWSGARNWTQNTSCRQHLVSKVALWLLVLWRLVISLS